MKLHLQLNDGLVLYSNAGKTTKRGAEIEFNGKISDRLNFKYTGSVGNLNLNLQVYWKWFLK